MSVDGKISLNAILLCLVERGHFLQVTELSVELFANERLTLKNEFTSRFEGEFVEAEMAEECLQCKVNDLLVVGMVENQDRKGGSLKGMPFKDFLKKFKSLLGQHLTVHHVMQKEIHNGKEARDLLIAELVVLAELIVDIMKVKQDLIHLLALETLRLSVFLCVEPILGHAADDAEDGCEYVSLFFVGHRFSNVLGRIFVQFLCIEEELGLQLPLFLLLVLA